MKCYILALAVFALPAQAFEWPWHQQSSENYGFCKGFVSAGLGEFPVENLSRTQLWLSWNHVNRAMLPEGSITPEQIQAGQQRFASLLSAGDMNTLLETANGECDLVN